MKPSRIEQGQASSASPGLRYRADIDGLRAVAVSLVVLFHAGFWGTPGGFVGVDVFFVISGYLITSLLLREFSERGSIRLMDFWGRRMRRILPAGVLVLCASMVGAVLLLPPELASRAAKELPNAALYFINWRLADMRVDYFTADAGPSIYLQYWSLAIEEQFYAAWPLIVLLVAVAVYRLYRSAALARVYVLWTIIAISLASFGVCLYLTGQNQPLAFFGTFSRAWQLGLGGAIALMPLIPIHRYAGQGYGICRSRRHPCRSALPNQRNTLSGLRSHPSDGRRSSNYTCRTERGHWRRLRTRTRITGTRPIGQMVLLAISLALASPGSGARPVADCDSAALVLLVLLSLLLACLTYYFVERPARFSPYFTRSPRASVAAGLALSLGAAGFALLAQATFARPTIYLSTGKWVTADSVRDDKDDACMLSWDETMQKPCVYGDPSGSRRVVLFGDSHATALLPALEIAAKKNGWTLLVRTKSACPSMDVASWNNGLRRRYVECETWRDQVLSELADINPDVIVLANSAGASALDTNGGHLKGAEAQAAMLKGEISLVKKLLDQTTATIVQVQDVPRLPQDPVTCLLDNPMNETSCSWPMRKTIYPRGAYDGFRRVKILDVNNHICPSETCSAVLDGRIVMRDDDHLTASFARSLAPYFETILAAPPQ